jgi:ribosomal protein L18
MATRALAVGERMHHLRIFFSNKFVYAQVMRKTDGHVSTAPTPPTGQSYPPHPSPYPQNPNIHFDWPRPITPFLLFSLHATATITPPRVRQQILAAASTNEKVMREALPNLADKNAAAHVGRTIAARCEAASIPVWVGTFHTTLSCNVETRFN